MVRAMRFTIGAIAVLLSACTEHGMSPNTGDDDGPLPDAGTKLGCDNGQAGKIKFTRETSCGNDGSVEFCIPDGDNNFEALLANISPNIRCAPGGGRANCLATPGLLLCSYPTSFPAECTSPQGAMTDATWDDMCEIAGFSAVTEIVPTFVE